MASVLFETDRHEPLINEPWGTARVDAAIEHIVTRSRAVFAERGNWPSHPDDLAERAPAPVPTSYFGTAGIVWASRNSASGSPTTLHCCAMQPMHHSRCSNPSTWVMNTVAAC